jgi:succinoglycan biosynthesis protein ExoO
MLQAPAAATSNIIADNQILFYEDGSPSQYLLQGADWQQARTIDLPLYIRANTMFGKGPALGYLKPLIRRDRIADDAQRYDESLRIGEDYDLVVRLLRGGASFAFLPAAWYFYRRHSASISFRLADSDLSALITAADRFQAALPAQLTEALQAARQRRIGLVRAHLFALLVGKLKARNLFGALADLIRHPDLLPLLVNATREGVQRRLVKARTAGPRDTATDPATKKCGLIWEGDPASAAAVLTWLTHAGWQPTLHPVKRDAATIHQDGADALALTTARNSQLVLCNADSQLDLVPYLLSPDALVGVIQAAGERRAMNEQPVIRFTAAEHVDDAQRGQRLRALGLIET